MKKLSFIAIPLIVVMMFVGCSHSAEVSKNTDESLNVSVSISNPENGTDRSATEFENSTQISTTETTTVQTTTKPKETEQSTTAKTTTKPVDKKSAGQTTTKKVTTQKSTTTERQTTTKKVTTTQKQTTTKKVTTSAPYWCDEGGTHHSCDVGPIGWVNSYSEAQKKALRYIDSHADSGNFLVKECHNCGKFTAYITLD